MNWQGAGKDEDIVMPSSLICEEGKASITKSAQVVRDSVHDL